MSLSPIFNPTPTGIRVVLVRHGRSTDNDAGRYQGSSDRSVLTPAGRDMARYTGQALQSFSFDALYGSPLQRVQQTITELLPGLDQLTPQISTSTLLKEIHLPAWEGLPYNVVREEFSADYQCWLERPHQFSMERASMERASIEQPLRNPASEYLSSKGSGSIATLPRPERLFPLVDLYNRARQFWQETLPRHLGQTLLIVSHGGTNRALISTALGVQGDRYHSLQQSNCGISILNFPCSWIPSAHLEALNLTGHLGEFLPKLKAGKGGRRLILLPTGSHSQEISPEAQHLLATHLQSVPVDFILSEEAQAANTLTDLMGQRHPQAIHFRVHGEDFPMAWHPQLNLRPADGPMVDEQALLSGIVVARASVLNRLVASLLGVAAETVCPLQLGTFSVIHYPIHHPPVLQVLNASPLQSLATSCV